jgi:DNA-binding NarL/FixJ family response regulator
MRNAPPELHPDVVVVSHSLTIDYQISILRDLGRLFPGAPLLVEGYDETLDAIANVLTGGAKGYFQLSSEPENLLKALAVVHKGRIWAPREAVALMVNGFSNDAPTPESGLITPHARSILNLLQQGLSNKEIAQSLGVSEVTVKSHLTKLYRRLGVHNRLELLTYAINHHLISGH